MPTGRSVEQHTGEARLIDEHEDIERVAIFGQGAGHEAVIAGVVHGGIEGAVEAEDAQFAVVLVFVGRVLRDLDDHANNFGAVRPRIHIVQAVFHLLIVTARARSSR